MMKMMSVRPIVGAGALALVTALASACATARAKAAPDAPALDMPAPPARVVDATEVEPPQPATLPDEPARHMPPQSSRRPPPPRADTTRPPEPPPSTAPVEAPKPAAEPPKPPPALQTTPTDVAEKEEQQIRMLLGRANTDLSHVDYQRLNADARTQYDTAKRFVTQAEDALRTKNLVFARSVADKAATLAAQLAGK
jgi:type IV secretory pathway VirB10-like protein